MIRFRLLAGCILLVSVVLGPTASATLVSESFQGIITSQSGDVDALFGTSGGIIGSTVETTVSFDTAAFGVPGPGSNGFGHFWDSTDGSLPNGVVRMTQTINGVTLIYDGTYYDNTLVTYGCPGGTPCGPWAYNTWTQNYSAVSETSTPYGIDAAQINLGMLDDSAAMTNPSLDPGGPFDFGAAEIGSNGANWVTATLAAEWDYQIMVPEPAMLGPLVVGAAVLSKRLRRAGAHSAETGPRKE
jgi:hypothetical protein